MNSSRRERIAIAIHGKLIRLPSSLSCDSNGAVRALLLPLFSLLAAAHLPAAPDDYYTIPAAATDKLTPAAPWPAPESYRTWERSLGGATSNRFSALTQIDKTNVAKLKVAWTYHSGDGTGNIQCNPIIVDGVMYAPTGRRAHRGGRWRDGHGALAVPAGAARQAARGHAGAPRAALLARRGRRAGAAHLHHGRLHLRARSEDRPAARELWKRWPHARCRWAARWPAQSGSACSWCRATAAMSSATMS